MTNAALLIKNLKSLSHLFPLLSVLICATTASDANACFFFSKTIVSSYHCMLCNCVQKTACKKDKSLGANKKAALEFWTQIAARLSIRSPSGNAQSSGPVMRYQKKIIVYLLFRTIGICQLICTYCYNKLHEKIYTIIIRTYVFTAPSFLFGLLHHRTRFQYLCFRK